MKRDSKTVAQGLGKPTISRRTFIKSLGVAGGSLVLGELLKGNAFSDTKPGEPIGVLDIVTHTGSQTIEGSRLILEQWRKLGLEARYTPMPSPSLIPKVFKREYEQLAYVKWSTNAERYDPGFWLSELYHSKNAKPGRRNWGDYSNPKLDAVIDQQEQELDIDKRRELIWKAQAIAAEGHPIWYIVYPNLISAFNVKRWEGWVNMLGSPPFWANTPWNLINLRPKTEEKILRWSHDMNILSKSPFAQATGPTQAFVRVVYDRFVQISPELKVVPWAAESWKWVDNTTLDLKIRKGMKFHDGKPVTPEDAAFSFEYFQKHNIPRYGLVTRNLKGVKVLDDGIVRLHLENPSASYIGEALVWAHIIPKHIWENVEKPLEFEDSKMIGSGPFMLKEWKSGESFLFMANKDHFSKPKMDGFYYIIVPAIEIQIGMLESGESDLLGTSNLSPHRARELAKNPDLDYMVTEETAFHEMRPRVKVKPFDDVAFRKALHHAIPKERILKIAYEGEGVVGHNTPITPKNTYWHNPDIPFVDFDVEKSKKILEKAGYFRNSKGQLCYPKKKV